MWDTFRRRGRIWNGTRTIGETLDEGHPSGASGRVSKRRHLPEFLFRELQHLNSFTYEYRRFRKPAKEVVRRPDPVSLPTTTQAGERCRRRPDPPSPTTAIPTYAVPSKLRRCQPRSPFLSLRVWVVSRMTAVAIWEPSAPQERALSLPYTDTWESQWIRRGSWCHPQPCIRWGHTSWRADRRLANSGADSPPSFEYPAAA